MKLYPNLYLNNVTEINIDIIKKNKIEALILDVDNTLIDYYENMNEGISLWCKNLKNNNIKFCILSNSNNKNKIEKISNKLEIPYVLFAKKPFKNGYIKAKNILKINKIESIAMVGDQIFTDIYGANILNMFSILVKPIDKAENFLTFIKRPLENLIIKKYLKKQGE